MPVLAITLCRNQWILMSDIDTKQASSSLITSSWGKGGQTAVDIDMEGFVMGSSG